MNLKSRNVKIGAAVAGGVVVVGAVASITYVTFFDHQDARYKDQAAMLAAMPQTATGELTGRGLKLTAPLGCWTMPQAAPKDLRVGCGGQTSKGQQVQIFGSQQSSSDYFTVLVDGRPVVQNASCLGKDCKGN